MFKIILITLMVFVNFSPVCAENNFYALFNAKKKMVEVRDHKGRYRGTIPERRAVDVINMPGGAIVLDDKGRYVLWSIPNMRRKGIVPNIYGK